MEDPAGLEAIFPSLNVALSPALVALFWVTYSHVLSLISRAKSATDPSWCMPNIVDIQKLLSQLIDMWMKCQAALLSQRSFLCCNNI